MQKGFSLLFLCGMLRQDLKGEECSVVRNRAGLLYGIRLPAGIPKAVQILQQPECCFSLRCEHLVKDIARTNLALLSAIGNERGW